MNVPLLRPHLQCCPKAPKAQSNSPLLQQERAPAPLGTPPAHNLHPPSQPAAIAEAVEQSVEAAYLVDSNYVTTAAAEPQTVVVGMKVVVESAVAAARLVVEDEVEGEIAVAEEFVGTVAVVVEELVVRIAAVVEVLERK